VAVGYGIIGFFLEQSHIVLFEWLMIQRYWDLP
jgi:hypothetical protein